jgi:hypothetical protein
MGWSRVAWVKMVGKMWIWIKVVMNLVGNVEEVVEAEAGAEEAGEENIGMWRIWIKVSFLLLVIYSERIKNANDTELDDLFSARTEPRT